jgi:hypothetical protein
MLQLALIAASVSGLCLSAVLLFARHDAWRVDERGEREGSPAGWYVQRVPQAEARQEDALV